MNGFSTELVKRQDKMKDAINASTCEGLQSKVEEALERENDDLRAQNEEMRKLKCYCDENRSLSKRNFWART